MKTTNEGKFYTQFKDETWQEAIDGHADGFDSIDEAVIYHKNIQEVEASFVVKNHNGLIVRRIEGGLQ